MTARWPVKEERAAGRGMALRGGGRRVRNGALDVGRARGVCVWLLGGLTWTDGTLGAGKADVGSDDGGCGDEGHGEGGGGEVNGRGEGEKGEGGRRGKPCEIQKRHQCCGGGEEGMSGASDLGDNWGSAVSGAKG